MRAEGGRIVVPFTEPYHTDALLAALAAHSVSGVEHTDVAARTHVRALRTPSGTSVVTVAFEQGHVVIASKPPVDDEAWLTTLVRRWLDLDADSCTIDGALGDDRLVGSLVRARPGLRVLGYAEPFAGAVMAVMGQQVSLAATRTFGSRLVAAFGTPVGDGLRVYPTAQTLAALTPDEVRSSVGLTRARAATVVRLAEAFAGGLRLERGADAVTTRARLLALPGVGPWTVDYLSVRALGDRDAYVPGDLVLRRALGAVTPREAAAHGEAWRPYRAYALFHLWTEAAYLARGVGAGPIR